MDCCTGQRKKKKGISGASSFLDQDQHMKDAPSPFPTPDSDPIMYYSSSSAPFSSATSSTGVFLLDAAVEAEDVDEVAVGAILGKQLFR